LGNAAALLDELVPLAATKLLPGSVQAMGGEKALRTSTLTARSPELKDLRRRLQKAVDKLKLYLCNEIVVGLCYDEYGSKLSAATYFQVEKDQPMWQTDPMPTALFQSLFVKLTSIQQKAANVLPGRERVTHLLLIRLTETFVIELQTNQEVWGLVEDEPTSLGSIALQQFILDLEFLSLVAKNGNFLSRTVFQAITEQEERMKDAYMVSGADLDSALPDPEWLLSAVQDNFERLLETWNRQSGGVPYDVTSPTSQSVSSFRSE